MSLVTGLLSAAVPSVRRLSERDRAEREVLQLSPPREHGAFHSALAQTLCLTSGSHLDFLFNIQMPHNRGKAQGVHSHQRKGCPSVPKQRNCGKRRAAGLTLTALLE